MSLSPEGLEWREYFRRMKEARVEAERAAEDHEEVLEVIEPSRPARLDDLSASVRGIIAALAVYGFVSASQVTRVLQEGTEYKTGEKAGERRPDKELTNVFLHAAHPDGRNLSGWWQDGKLKTARIRTWPGEWTVVDKMGDVDRFIEGGTDG